MSIFKLQFVLINFSIILLIIKYYLFDLFEGQLKLYDLQFNIHNQNKHYFCNNELFLHYHHQYFKNFYLLILNEHH